MAELTEAERLLMAHELAAELFPADISYRPQVVKLAKKLINAINASKATEPERTTAVVGILADMCSRSPDPATSAYMISGLLLGWVGGTNGAEAKH